MDSHLLPRSLPCSHTSFRGPLQSTTFTLLPFCTTPSSSGLDPQGGSSTKIRKRRSLSCGLTHVWSDTLSSGSEITRIHEAEDVQRLGDIGTRVGTNRGKGSMQCADDVEREGELNGAKHDNWLAGGSSCLGSEYGGQHEEGWPTIRL